MVWINQIKDAASSNHRHLHKVMLPSKSYHSEAFIPTTVKHFHVKHLSCAHQPTNTYGKEATFHGQNTIKHLRLLVSLGVSSLVSVFL